MNDDFMDELSKVTPKRRPTPARSSVETGLGSAVDLRSKVDKAADSGKSKKHGQYVQFTMRLDESDVDAIKRWADKLDLPQTHMYRWVVARGLLALEEGELPEIEYRQVPKVIPPK